MGYHLSWEEKLKVPLLPMKKKFATYSNATGPGRVRGVAQQIFYFW